MKIRHLVWLRRSLQGLFLIFFLYLVIESRLAYIVNRQAIMTHL